jgi:isoleucyl-tRNA synthetase
MGARHRQRRDLDHHAWTLPGNRAISFSPKISYGLYKVTDAPGDNWAKNGDLLILADALAESVFKQARVTAYEKVREIPATRWMRWNAPIR